jgi:parvulin-like peptidyl-prolyl isomerase
MKLFVFVAASAAFLCAQAPLQLPINPLPASTVVAKTPDGKAITAGEIQSILQSGDRQALTLAKASPEQFLVNIFVMRYLKAEGDKMHIAEQSPLKEQLEYMRDYITAGAVVNQLRETYIVSDEAIADFYAHNQSRYEQARIKVIAIGFCPAVAKNGGTSDEAIAQAAREAVAAAGCKNKHTEDAAHEIAIGLVGQIRGGKDFVEMVAKYSEDPDSKATEGDFGLVTRENSFKQEIKDAVFALNNGDVSDPIRSGNFFYIIKIKEKAVQPVANVRDQIVQELKQKHFTDFMQDLTQRFRPQIERPDFFVTQEAPKPGGPPQLIKP